MKTQTAYQLKVTTFVITTGTHRGLWKGFELSRWVDEKMVICSRRPYLSPTGDHVVDFPLRFDDGAVKHFEPQTIEITEDQYMLILDGFLHGPVNQSLFDGIDFAEPVEVKYFS